MNTGRMLAVEYIIAVSISSWAAIKGDGKHKYWPWPPTIVLSTVAFGILGILAIPQPRIAGALGAGFLLAQVIRAFGKGSAFDLSGIPQSAAFKTYNEAGPGGQYYRILTF